MFLGWGSIKQNYETQICAEKFITHILYNIHCMYDFFLHIIYNLYHPTQ